MGVEWGSFPKEMLLQLLFQVMCWEYYGNGLKESTEGACRGGYRGRLLYVFIAPSTCS